MHIAYCQKRNDAHRAVCDTASEVSPAEFASTLEDVGRLVGEQVRKSDSTEVLLEGHVRGEADLQLCLVHRGPPENPQPSHPGPGTSEPPCENPRG